MSKPIDKRRRPERTAQIQAAALGVFSRRGYAQASLREIAKAAGLKSAQLLYWYFPNKRALYESTVLRYAGLVIDVFRETPAQTLAPDVFLKETALTGLRAFESEDVRMAYQLLLKGEVGPEDAPRHIEDYVPINLYTRLAEYLRFQVCEGVLGPHDCELAAQLFIGQIWAQIEARYFVPMIFPKPRSDEAFVEGMVGLFLAGLRP